MSRGGSAPGIRVTWAVTAFCAVASVLIWMLWVLPINDSLRDAAPEEFGGSIAVTLTEGERVGIWTSGISAMLDTESCTVEGPDGDPVALRSAPSLDWDDTLWWVTARSGFSQSRAFTADAAGSYRVTCVDSLSTYDGEMLVAGDSFGAGSIGLGRLGAADYPVGAVLAFCAVVLPLTAVLLVPIGIVRTLRARNRR